MVELQATEEHCPAATLDFAARDGRLVLTFRETPSAPLVTVSCGYGDCEWVPDVVALTFTVALRNIDAHAQEQPYAVA